MSTCSVWNYFWFVEIRSHVKISFFWFFGFLGFRLLFCISFFLRLLAAAAHTPFLPFLSLLPCVCVCVPLYLWQVDHCMEVWPQCVHWVECDSLGAHSGQISWWAFKKYGRSDASWIHYVYESSMLWKLLVGCTGWNHQRQCRMGILLAWKM